MKFQTSRRIRVSAMPTMCSSIPTANLWRSSRPRKTAYDAEKGRAQAKLYADGLEKKYGQRPIIFCTNGFDIFIWDDAKGEVPRKLYGFYGKDSLQTCLWRTRSTAAEAGGPESQRGNR